MASMCHSLLCRSSTTWRAPLLARRPAPLIARRPGCHLPLRSRPAKLLPLQPCRRLHLRRLQCSATQQQPTPQRPWITLWAVVDGLALVGSVAGAVGVFLGVVGSTYLWLPMALPVVSLIAGLQKEGLLFEASRQDTERLTGDVVAVTQLLADCRSIIEDLRQELKRAGLDAASSKLTAIDSRLGAVEAATLDSGRSAREAAALSAGLQADQRAQYEALVVGLRHELRRAMEASGGEQAGMLSRVDARLAGVEASLGGLELSQVEGMRRLSSNLHNVIADAETTLQASLRNEVARATEPVRRLPQLLAAVLPPAGGGGGAGGGGWVAATAAPPGETLQRMPAGLLPGMAGSDGAALAVRGPADGTALVSQVAAAVTAEVDVAVQRILDSQVEVLDRLSQGGVVRARLHDEQWNLLGSRLSHMERLLEQLPGSAQLQMRSELDALRSDLGGITVREVSALRAEVGGTAASIQESGAALSASLRPIREAVVAIQDMVGAGAAAPARTSEATLQLSALASLLHNMDAKMDRVSRGLKAVQEAAAAGGTASLPAAGGTTVGGAELAEGVMRVAERAAAQQEELVNLGQEMEEVRKTVASLSAGLQGWSGQLGGQLEALASAAATLQAQQAAAAAEASQQLRQQQQILQEAAQQQAEQQKAVVNSARQLQAALEAAEQLRYERNTLPPAIMQPDRTPRDYAVNGNGRAAATDPSTSYAGPNVQDASREAAAADASTATPSAAVPQLPQAPTGSSAATAGPGVSGTVQLGGPSAAVPQLPQGPTGSSAATTGSGDSSTIQLEGAGAALPQPSQAPGSSSAATARSGDSSAVGFGAEVPRPLAAAGEQMPSNTPTLFDQEQQALTLSPLPVSAQEAGTGTDATPSTSAQGPDSNGVPGGRQPTAALPQSAELSVPSPDGLAQASGRSGYGYDNQPMKQGEAAQAGNGSGGPSSNGYGDVQQQGSRGAAASTSAFANPYQDPGWQVPGNESSNGSDSYQGSLQQGLNRQVVMGGAPRATPVDPRTRRRDSSGVEYSRGQQGPQGGVSLPQGQQMGEAARWRSRWDEEEPGAPQGAAFQPGQWTRGEQEGYAPPQGEAVGAAEQWRRDGEPAVPQSAPEWTGREAVYPKPAAPQSGPEWTGRGAAIYSTPALPQSAPEWNGRGDAGYAPPAAPQPAAEWTGRGEAGYPPPAVPQSAPEWTGRGEAGYAPPVAQNVDRSRTEGGAIRADEPAREQAGASRRQDTTAMTPSGVNLLEWHLLRQIEEEEKEGQDPKSRPGPASFKEGGAVGAGAPRGAVWSKGGDDDDLVPLNSRQAAGASASMSMQPPSPTAAGPPPPGVTAEYPPFSNGSSYSPPADDSAATSPYGTSTYSVRDNEGAAMPAYGSPTYPYPDNDSAAPPSYGMPLQQPLARQQPQEPAPFQRSAQAPSWSAADAQQWSGPAQSASIAAVVAAASALPQAAWSAAASQQAGQGPLGPAGTRERGVAWEDAPEAIPQASWSAARQQGMAERGARPAFGDVPVPDQGVPWEAAPVAFPQPSWASSRAQPPVDFQDARQQDSRAAQQGLAYGGTGSSGALQQEQQQVFQQPAQPPSQRLLSQPPIQQSSQQLSTPQSQRASDSSQQYQLQMAGQQQFQQPQLVAAQRSGSQQQQLEPLFPEQAGDGSLSPQQMLAEGLKLLKTGREATAAQAFGEGEALLEGAASWLQAAVAAAPRDPRALGNLGNALLAQGQLKKAMLDAGSASPAGRPDPRVQQRLRDEANQHLTTAGDMFRRVLEAEGWSSRALLNWGTAMCLRAELAGNPDIVEKLYQAAIDKFEAVLEEEPGAAAAKLRCALAMRGLADCPNVARRDARTLLQDAANYLQDVLTMDSPEAAALHNSAAEALAACQRQLAAPQRR